MASEARRVGETTAREREMRRIAAAGARDGLTLRETASRAGMPAGTLAWWRSEIRRRDRLRATRDDEPVFIEVVAKDDRAVESGASTGPGVVADAQPLGGDAARVGEPDFEVELRGGRRLRVAARYGLARLVREIEGC